MTIEQKSHDDDGVSDEILTFRLPNNRVPGKDQFSKQMLKTQGVIDLVVGELLDVPDGTYMSAETEWQNASRSDILYKPRLAIQNSLPPILIEIQLTVNEPFMQRLVSYSQSALSIYKTYPIVLIVCTDRVSPIQLMAKFKPISGKPWMSSLLATDFWAQSCFIVSKLTLSGIAPSDQLTPLQALSSFLTEASPTLYGHPFAENRTIRQLYHIAMAISENQVECDKDVSNVVDIICYNNEKILMKADAALFGVSGSSKAKNLIERALVFNAAAKRKYYQTVDSDSDSSLEPLPKLKGKTRETIQDKKQDDLEFVIKYRKNLIGKMNWKTCLSVGHEKNLCEDYSTGESLRQFFYNATKK
ncbi:hypothetical protein J3Q64DRAFT_1824822 [Phycomyces blakesleeanus]